MMMINGRRLEIFGLNRILGRIMVQIEYFSFFIYSLPNTKFKGN